MAGYIVTLQRTVTQETRCYIEEDDEEGAGTEALLPYDHTWEDVKESKIIVLEVNVA